MALGSTPLLSYIVPAWNMEQYLGECLQSIRNQDPGDFEAIVINDGSTDQTAAVIEEFARKDARFRVITQDRGGLSRARNAGLAAARGKYIHFLDADDLVSTDMLASSTAAAEAANLQMLHFNGQVFRDEGYKPDNFRPNRYQRSSFARDEALLRDLLRTGKFRPSACLYIVRRDYLQQLGLTFTPDILREDQGFTLRAMAHAQRCALLEQDLFLNRVREGSIMTAAALREHWRSQLQSFIDMAEWFTQPPGISQSLQRPVHRRIRKYFRNAAAMARAENDLWMFRLRVLRHWSLVRKFVGLRQALALSRPGSG